MKDIFFHSEPHMKPAEFAAVVGMSPDMQRDWRRRGYFPEGFGVQQDSGRWLYDWQDALYVFVLQEIYELGMDVITAQRFTSTVSGFVVKAAQFIRGINPAQPQYRYIQGFKDSAPKADAGGGWAMQPINSLEHLHGAGAYVIDTWEIARKLPRQFNEPLRKAEVPMEEFQQKGEAD